MEKGYWSRVLKKPLWDTPLKTNMTLEKSPIFNREAHLHSWWILETKQVLSPAVWFIGFVGDSHGTILWQNSLKKTVWKLEIILHQSGIPSLKLTANAPENGGPLEKEIPSLETTMFRGELLVSGSVIFLMLEWNISPIKTKSCMTHEISIDDQLDRILNWSTSKTKQDIQRSVASKKKTRNHSYTSNCSWRFSNPVNQAWIFPANTTKICPKGFNKTHINAVYLDLQVSICHDL